MTHQELRASRKRLEHFAHEVLGSLRHAKQRGWGQVYLQGLLLEGRRKSVQPMAQRLPEGNEQNLQQFLNQSPWAWEPVREAIERKMVAALGGGGAWIVDDTGFPKQGTHSVGVAHQYSGTLGKTGNCQLGISLSYATAQGAMPLEWALYLPEEWTQDLERRQRVGIPEQVEFAPKWRLALGLMDHLLERGLPRPEVVVADTDYGRVRGFRQGLSARGLRYVVGVKSTQVARREPEEVRAPSLKVIAQALPASCWQRVCWREGSKGELCSRFARLRVHPAVGTHMKPVPHPEVWLLVEWPEAAPEPTKYWYSDLPEETSLERLVYWAKSRWAVELSYREMKDHLGLDHFEGRGWVGWHHHVTMVMLAYGFVLLERLEQAKGGHPRQASPKSWGGSSFSSRPGAAPAPHAVSPSVAALGGIVF